MDEFPTKSTPQDALEHIRQKMLTIVGEYSNGEISAVQFNAIYRHYTEKRKIIERMVERNPDTTAWRAPAAAGMTMMLRQQFEARLMYYAVFRREGRNPIMMQGKMPRSVVDSVYNVLKAVWGLDTWRVGIARKSVGNGYWLILVVGEKSYTLLIYKFQPSDAQIDEVRTVHDDFERANQRALQRNEEPKRMVFPQRALSPELE